MNRNIIAIIIIVAHLEAISKSLKEAKKIGEASSKLIKNVGVSVKYSLDIKVENLQKTIIITKKTKKLIRRFIMIAKDLGKIVKIFSDRFFSGKKLKAWINTNIKTNPNKKLIIKLNSTEVFASLIKYGKTIPNKFESIRQITIKAKLRELIL